MAVEDMEVEMATIMDLEEMVCDCPFCSLDQFGVCTHEFGRLCSCWSAAAQNSNNFQTCTRGVKS